MPDFENTGKALSHVVLLIDESASMGLSRDTTVSTTNEFLQGLKASLDPESYVSVLKFNTAWPTSNQKAFTTAGGYVINVRPIFKRTRLKDVPLVTLDHYKPQGGTPLYDAIGRTINEMDIYVSAENGPVFFGIITDGEENESKEFNQQTIKKLIEDRTAKGWTFTFMGVDIDAYGGARSIGIADKDVVGLTRGTVGMVGATLSSNYARKGAMFASNPTTYATWNLADATFSAEEKSTLEDKK